MRYSGKLSIDLVIRLYNKYIDYGNDMEKVYYTCWKHHNECLYKAGRELIGVDQYIRQTTQGDLITLIKSRAVVVRHLEDIDQAVAVIRDHYTLKLIKGGIEP